MLSLHDIKTRSLRYHFIFKPTRENRYPSLNTKRLLTEIADISSSVIIDEGMEGCLIPLVGNIQRSSNKPVLI